MAKRDPHKTALNKQIKSMGETLRTTEAQVQKYFGVSKTQALHGIIGGKNHEFIDVKEAVILSPEQYVACWIDGLLAKTESRKPFTKHDQYAHIVAGLQKNPVVRDYVLLFQRRTYLRNRDALSRKRPSVADAEMWIGQNHAEYGLLVTPRYRNGVWENDKSEIRHFPKGYWTIGHMLQSGLVVPGDPDKITFRDVESYLVTFKNTLVRASGSSHEKAIARRYVEFVRTHPDPESVPLMTPELRYDGLNQKHKYRLDFTIINPFTLEKVGVELSPWSTHGSISGAKKKTQKEINQEGKANADKEARKRRDFFLQRGVTVLTYTDESLANPDAIFEELKPFLAPNREVRQLELHALDALDRFQL